MRIIAGEFRHRKLISPPDSAPTRPIPDRAKEAIFNLLRGWTEDAVVFDVFAGSGAIGLEAVSRGASRCVFVEKDRRMAEVLQRNIDMLGCTDRCEVIRADALGPALLTRAPRDIDLVFFDPPYPLVQEESGWDRVTLQFRRVMDLMKDKSFAMIRTPWPFRHFVPDPGQPAPPPPWERDEENEDVRAWEGEDLRVLEASGFDESLLMDDEDEEDMEVAEKRAGHWINVKLEMAGAEGPETHVYGSTAVHLYMPKRAKGGSSGTEQQP